MERLRKKKSLVFFYLNYDNPVSAEEYRYAVVGCARLSDIQRTGSFKFSRKEMEDVCNGKGMQNFGAAQWALEVVGVISPVPGCYGSRTENILLTSRADRG